MFGTASEHDTASGRASPCRDGASPVPSHNSTATGALTAAFLDCALCGNFCHCVEHQGRLRADLADWPSACVCFGTLSASNASVSLARNQVILNSATDGVVHRHDA